MITTLGEPKFPSPLSYSVDDRVQIPATIKVIPGEKYDSDMMFELAGPRSRLFFNPPETRAGIVTCGGLCPGMNNVIRSVFLELHFIYGIKEIFGFRYGYKGLDPANGIEPVLLTHDYIKNIHREGGTILGTSRGPVDIKASVDNLIRQKINILFTIGGDGTQKGGYDLFREAQKCGHPLAVVGIPKTIDNDVSYVSRTFGYQTAVEESWRILDQAHVEATSVEYGIGLVKLMGRHAGFIAVGATEASQDVNFILIPEAPFALHGENGFLHALKNRMVERKHAVIVVAEGAGQDRRDGDGLRAATDLVEEPQRAQQRLRARQVRLVDEQQVGRLDDPGLEGLDDVPGAGLQDEHDQVGAGQHVQLRLADPDGLDEDPVHPERVEDLRRVGRGGGEAPVALAAGHRADEHAVVADQALHADAVAQERAAREGARRIHGDDAHGVAGRE